jgi:hypothetical protein
MANSTCNFHGASLVCRSYFVGGDTFVFAGFVSSNIFDCQKLIETREHVVPSFYNLGLSACDGVNFIPLQLWNRAKEERIKV